MTTFVPNNRKMDDELIRRETLPEPGRPASLDMIISALKAQTNSQQNKGAVKFKDAHATWHHVKVTYTFDHSNTPVAMSLEIIISTEVYKQVKGAGRIPEWEDVTRTIKIPLDERWFMADCVQGSNLAKTGLTAIKRANERNLSALERHALQAWVSSIR